MTAQLFPSSGQPAILAGMMMLRTLMMLLVLAPSLRAENWPRWRGPDGSGLSSETRLPTRWSPTEQVAWKIEIPGEGSSSPILWGEKIFLTSARERGRARLVHCLDSKNGKLLWSRSLECKNPETTSAVTGHAASTPATDGTHVVAWFGNAGVVCFDFAGKQLWHHPFAEFESELGLASSPILHDGKVILVCDHDGSRFTSFDSFLIALDVKTGRELWKTPRPKLERSWSTPILVPGKEDKPELIVNAQDGVRAYDPATGKELWHQKEKEERWVTPSPVFGHGLIFATSGKDGPIVALKPGSGAVAWRQDRGGPYVCSPVLVGDHLYVLLETGFLLCFEAKTGKQLYRERLAGKFTSSPAAGAGHIYLTNEAGATFIVRAAAKFELVGQNKLNEYTVASPAIAAGRLFLRTEKHLFAIGGQ
ncbi:MAG: PQQ-binding-like beta-propeller repeat protein [Gemmataceae bacterium]